MISISFDVDEYYVLLDALVLADDLTCESWCNANGESHCDSCVRIGRLRARILNYEGMFNS